MIDEARLSEIEARYEALKPYAAELGMQSIVTDLADVLAEVRRLTRENHLLNLSRGTPSVVEGDERCLSCGESGHGRCTRS